MQASIIVVKILCWFRRDAHELIFVVESVHVVPTDKLVDKRFTEFLLQFRQVVLYRGMMKNYLVFLRQIQIK